MALGDKPVWAWKGEGSFLFPALTFFGHSFWDLGIFSLLLKNQSPYKTKVEFQTHFTGCCYAIFNIVFVLLGLFDGVWKGFKGSHRGLADSF